MPLDEVERALVKDAENNPWDSTTVVALRAAVARRGLAYKPRDNPADLIRLLELDAGNH